MFIKNILKAFNRDTKIEAYLDNNLLDYGTVGEFMDSGLMTYSSIDINYEENLLTIEDNKIIIYIT